MEYAPPDPAARGSAAPGLLQLPPGRGGSGQRQPPAHLRARAAGVPQLDGPGLPQPERGLRHRRLHPRVGQDPPLLGQGHRHRSDRLHEHRQPGLGRRLGPALRNRQRDRPAHPNQHPHRARGGDRRHRGRERLRHVLGSDHGPAVRDQRGGPDDLRPVHRPRDAGGVLHVPALQRAGHQPRQRSDVRDPRHERVDHQDQQGVGQGDDLDDAAARPRGADLRPEHRGPPGRRSDRRGVLRVQSRQRSHEGHRVHGLQRDLRPGLRLEHQHALRRRWSLGQAGRDQPVERQGRGDRQHVLRRQLRAGLRPELEHALRIRAPRRQPAEHQHDLRRGHDHRTDRLRRIRRAGLRREHGHALRDGRPRSTCSWSTT